MMINRKKKICNECGRVDYLFSKGRCKSCSQKAYAKKRNEGKPEQRNADNKFYMKIWGERKHVCFNCGFDLGYEPRKYHFHHIIEKQQHDELRYEPENIVLLCGACHTNVINLPTVRELYQQVCQTFGIEPNYVV